MGNKKIRGIHLLGRRLSRRADPRLAWKGRAGLCAHENGGARLVARPSGTHAPAWLKWPRGPLPTAPPCSTKPDLGPPWMDLAPARPPWLGSGAGMARRRAGEVRRWRR
ncbi:hypothetical protein PVAP13_4NG162811 [Panicum virgatum]|uniref:Uncharacterized protein n=1 Tax=Panicum virgatum TaxID=38727 RepID=A0A8T0T727_PANVG|nr:hypothetical protein PVAP13_4NG162811 [Panicum virgatum]